MKPYYEDGQATFYQGDVIERLREMPENSVHTCVTSPPYWGLRDYGVDGQLGLEATPEAFIETMVGVFREVRRVLRDDGTCWINIGDSYAGYHGNKNATYDAAPSNKGGYFENQRKTLVNHNGIKNKDLVGIPWMLAFALRADGWYLRQDIIWAKSNPMPESVTDRCTKAHEYLFLFAKGQWKTRVVKFADLPRQRFHFSEDFRAKGTAVSGSARLPIDLAATIFDSAKREYQFTLPPFYAEEWKQLSDGVSSAFVRDLPIEHRPAIWAARYLCSDITAEEFLRQVQGILVALPDGDHLLKRWAMTSPNAHAPSITSNGEGAVTVHYPGEICKVDFSTHTVRISRASGSSYFYDQEAIREASDPDSPFWRTHPQGQKAISRTSRLDGNNEAAPNTWLTGLEPGSGRNKRSVWTIATEAFSARALGGGTTGIRSADCPVHGDSPLAAQARQAARRDAQRDAAAPGSDGTGNHPAPLPPLEQSSNGATRSDSDYQPETQPERIEGSTPSRKTLASLPRGGDPLAGDQTPTSTERTSVECVAQVGSSDSGDQSRVASAKGRSSENHKTGHAPETIQPYTASAQNEPSTPRMSELPGFFDSAAHTSVSSTAPADSDGHPSAQTQSRTAGKLSCSCIVPDHFATFPTALVKPCILAGTSERGVCSQCGGPWLREVEKSEPVTRVVNDARVANGLPKQGNLATKRWDEAPVITTVGWAPSCKHEAPAVPATVLDPFLGSGTTAYVAKSLGRHAVGIDLNPEYLELARRRCAQMGLEMVS